MEEAKKTKFYKRLIYKQFSKSQVLVAHSFCRRVICGNVSGTCVELRMEAPYLCTCSFGTQILRFHCHGINTAEKNKLETVQCKKPRLKLKFYKRLIYKQFVQISGLCESVKDSGNSTFLQKGQLC